MKEFVHLHNHSDYSLLKATSTVSGLVSAAGDMNMPGIALTDDGNLFGACEFYKACKEKGINPIVGCDFFLAPEGRHQKSKVEDGRRYQRIVLLAKNNAGYRNLIMLSSLGYTEGFYYKPRIDRELLQQYNEGLIALSGGLGGHIPQLISRNRIQEAREAADFYAQIFGREHFYLELSDHDIAEQKQVNRVLVDMSRDMGIGLVASNDTYYLQAEDASAHDVLLCIGNKHKLSDAGRFRFSSEQFYLKSPDEMWMLFGEYPEALKNTIRIHEACELEMEFPGPLLPDYDIPPDFDGPDSYLRHISQEGLLRRYGEPDEKLQARLDYELNTIISMGFTGYFLIVWDFIHHARNSNIPVGPGRGSGAGSIVAYSLEITDIDPMQYGLLFERFLNPERISMPDFDIDFCFERRQELIDYVTGKYGKERVGQIITFGTLKPRAAIRDVARVLDFSYDEADRIAKLIPEGLKTTIETALEDEPQLRELYESDERCRELIDISRKLQKLHRHASTHAAGIVIGKDDLTHYVPLFRDARTGAISTQFTMDQLEDNGLVKMDILGLKTLTLIQNTLNLIGETDAEFDIDAIPTDDPVTFELLGQGKSLAVFQFESDGMQKILAQAKPNCIEDLIALNSLYRPGPMENISQFIDSKLGRIDIRYPHPSLEAILKETYGIIVYQEQVLETVRIIGGFSLGKADILRRAMGKKKEKEMAGMRVDYMEGATKNGVDEKTAASIFELLKPFAGYGFNKSHAAAYSVLAYKTAYLKAHYPVQFMAANLTNEIDNSDNFLDYLNETQGMDIAIHPPDINYSEKHFTVLKTEKKIDPGTSQGGESRPAVLKTEQKNDLQPGDHDRVIIFGLMGIKGVGSSVVDEILRQRSEGLYVSVEDLLERVDPKIVNRRVLEIMIQCGVLDSLFPSRQGILDQLDSLINTANSRRNEKQFGQTGLFDNASSEDYPAIVLNGEEEYPLITRLKWERELIGHYFSGHPLDSYKSEWASGSNLNLAKISGTKPGTRCQIVALVSQYREIMTRKGARMASGVLEDYKGEIEFVVFPEAFSQCSELLAVDTVLGFIADFEFKDTTPQLVVQEVRELEQMDHHENGSIHIRLATLPSDSEGLLNLRNILHTNPGSCPVLIHLHVNGNERIIRSSSNFRTSTSVVPLLEQHGLVKEVWREHLNTRV